MDREIEPARVMRATVSVYGVDEELKERMEQAYEMAKRLEVKRATCFYKIQTFRVLGGPTDQCQIGVHVNNAVSLKYLEHIKDVIQDINDAAPGIHLYKTDNITEAKITIGEGTGKGCYAQGTFKSQGGAYVHLDTDWNDDWKKQTTLHELLHALGFQHEFKRKDAEQFLHINTHDDQYKDTIDHQKLRGLTRFDPFSVMMYPETENMERRENGDIVWSLKPGKLPNKQMSELDKVALNMVFRPCKGDNYKPEIGPTGMFYCRRPVMTGNQQNVPTDTDGKCGPNNWANCPACRVLKTTKCQQMHDNGKWQGWNGLFYCGKQITSQTRYVKNRELFEHDGFCGPDNGPPCDDCGSELCPQYDYSKYVKSETEGSACVFS